MPTPNEMETKNEIKIMEKNYKEDGTRMSEKQKIKIKKLKNNNIT